MLAKHGRACKYRTILHYKSVDERDKALDYMSKQPSKIFAYDNEHKKGILVCDFHEEGARNEFNRQFNGK